MKFIMLHDIVEANGKTIKENNLELIHHIPIGTLVEICYDSWFGDGACEKVQARLWVVYHARDCDGTPLYILSRIPDYELSKQFHYLITGFNEERLTPVQVTQALRDGVDMLEWDS